MNDARTINKMCRAGTLEGAAAANRAAATQRSGARHPPATQRAATTRRAVIGGCCAQAGGPGRTFAEGLLASPLVNHPYPGTWRALRGSMRGSAGDGSGGTPPLSGGGASGGGRREGDGEDEVPSGLRRFVGGDAQETAHRAGGAYGLVGGLLGFGLLGWLADRYLGSGPYGLLGGLLLGGVAGFARLAMVMFGRR